MRRTTLGFPNGFHVAIGNKRSQCATMTIPPGGKEGGNDNKHDGADQWLLIVKGSGEAIVNGHEYDLTENTVMLIERGDTHEIRNTGQTPMKTLNFYVPPAYEKDGNELPAGEGNA